MEKILPKKNVYSWTNPKLFTKLTDKYGGGVFASEDIESYEMLAIFGGTISSINEVEKMENVYSQAGLQISEEMELTTGKSDEVANYFNHCCDPNAGFHGQIFLVPLRKILKGEEVTFDYAMVLHAVDREPAFSFKCMCGSKKCRNIVTDDDWMNPELQDRYKGFFQWYLQEKIDKIKKRN